jgi:hypothetical protein
MGKSVLQKMELHTCCEVNVRTLLPLDRVLVLQISHLGQTLTENCTVYF